MDFVYNFLCCPLYFGSCVYCLLIVYVHGHQFINSASCSHAALDSSTVDHNTTIGVNDLPTDLGAVRTGKENKDSCDLTRLSTAPNRSVEAFLRLLRHGRNDKWGPYRAGSDSVDANSLGHPLVAEAICECGDGTFGAGVVEQVWAANVGVHTGVVDDRVAFGHVREGVLGEVEEGCGIGLVLSCGGSMAGWLTVDVGVERLDPLLLWNVQDVFCHHLERVVIHQNIDDTHVLKRLLHRLLASLRRSQIRLVEVDLAAAILDHLLCVVGVALLVREICDHDFSSFHGVKHGNGSTDARVTAGDQGFATLEFASCFVGLHAAVVGWDLVYFGERIHLGLETGVVLALRRWGLPACLVMVLAV
jgi:hypothetical protein